MISKRVLVVDDHSGLRQTVADMLETRFDKSTIIQQAESVEQALFLLENNNFDLVISDLSMPGGSGDEIYSYLEARPELQTKFILYSGDFDPIKTPDWEKKFVAVLKPDYLKLLAAIRSTGILCDAPAVRR